MNLNGPLQSPEDVLTFFKRSQDFGTLFILSGPLEESRSVCELKNINEGLGEVSFVPINEDSLSFEVGTVIKGINETNNVFFSAKVQSNHNGKWVTLELPDEFRLVNLRQTPRLSFTKERLGTTPELASYGEDGQRKLMSFQGNLFDISTVGASFEVEALRLDGFFKGDVVELKASERYAFLARIRGQVVHKTLFESNKDKMRRYRIGIRFHKTIDLSPLQ